jgi:hypothetical protein
VVIATASGSKSFKNSKTKTSKLKPDQTVSPRSLAAAAKKAPTPRDLVGPPSELQAGHRAGGAIHVLGDSDPEVNLRAYNQTDSGFLRITIDGQSLLGEYFTVPFQGQAPKKAGDTFRVDLERHEVSD